MVQVLPSWNVQVSESNVKVQQPGRGDVRGKHQRVWHDALTRSQPICPEHPDVDWQKSPGTVSGAVVQLPAMQFPEQQVESLSHGDSLGTQQVAGPASITLPGQHAWIPLGTVPAGAHPSGGSMHVPSMGVEAGTTSQ